MKAFNCQHCGEALCFENTVCLGCGSKVGFIPGQMALSAFAPSGGGQWTVQHDPSGSFWKPCANYQHQNVCNWMLDADSQAEFCLSCALNEVIPDLSVDNNRDLWAKMEAAKRRLLYSLLSLNLPIYSKSADPSRGFAFRFLADPESTASQNQRVLTGHQNGVITINLAEADDAIRERTRLAMKEGYRTLLGHFRHESGHYFWDRFFADSGQQRAFREVFGDERVDYGKALQRLYRNGPPANWQESYISAYASTHPWEDWSETWAHFLLITDTLETAHVNGIEIRTPKDKYLVRNPSEGPFEAIIQDWFALSFVLNNLNRSIGTRDPYPFVMSPPVIAKLAFIHRWVQRFQKSSIPGCAGRHFSPRQSRASHSLPRSINTLSSDD